MEKNDRVVVVLGATGGIGRSVAEMLARESVQLVLAGRDGPALTDLSCRVQGRGIELDPRSAREVEDCIRETAKRFGRVDAVCNCVGSLLLKPIHLTTQREWTETINVNLGSAFATVRAAARVMKRGGSVVLCSTAATLVGIPNHEAIAAAKAGINGLVLSAAATYASRGLRFNAVAPGLTRTPLTKSITGNEMALKGSESMHPLGRIGKPEDIASQIVWLLNPANAWVTGQVLAVDGGLSALRPRPTVR